MRTPVLERLPIHPVTDIWGAGVGKNAWPKQDGEQRSEPDPHQIPHPLSKRMNQQNFQLTKGEGGKHSHSQGLGCE